MENTQAGEGIAGATLTGPFVCVGVQSSGSVTLKRGTPAQRLLPRYRQIRSERPGRQDDVFELKPRLIHLDLRLDDDPRRNLMLKPRLIHLGLRLDDDPRSDQDDDVHRLAPVAHVAKQTVDVWNAAESGRRSVLGAGFDQALAGVEHGRLAVADLEGA